MKKIIATLSILLLPIFAYGASWYSFPYQGGTGTNLVPTFGQILRGTSAGVYTPVSTSTLGIIDRGWDSIWGNSTTTGTQYAGVLKLPVIAAPTYEPGLLFYEQYGALNGLSFYNSEADTTLNIGKENWKDVRNCNSGSTILDGTAVYLTGVVVGQMPCVLPASATSFVNASVVGVATHDIKNNTNGVVTTFGVINGIDTTDLTEGTILYLATSTNGALNTYRNLTETKPTAPFYTVKVGETDYTHPTLGKIEVNISKPLSLVDNKDVFLSSLTNNQLLTYDSTLGYFKNVSDITVDNATTTSLVTGTISVPDYINFTGSSNNGNVFVGNNAGLYIKDFAGITLSTFIGNNAGTGSSTALSSLADGNTGVGINALRSLTSGSYNTAVGVSGLAKVTSGNGNIAIGRAPGQNINAGSYNIAIGSFTTLGNLANGNYNLALGYSAGYNTIGSSGIYLGSYAGAYETEGSTFYINNRNLTNTAGDKAYSLLYGTFGTGASTVGQQLTVNGRLAVGTSTPQRQFVVTSGATATTTIQFADVYSGTGKTCFEVGQTDGSIASFYFVGGAMIIETNACVE